MFACVCLEALVERDRALGVGAALHVDPQRPAASRPPSSASRARVCERPLDVEVVAELGELDAHLAVEVAGRDVVHEPEVVLGDRVALLEPS